MHLFVRRVAFGERAAQIGGHSLGIFVGAAGRERYGDCLTRLTPARLADGYLPILETSYVDAHGVRYSQESFVGRVYEKTPVR